MLLTQLHKKYPNNNISIEVRITDKPPIIHITPEGANLTVPIVLDFYVLEKRMHPLVFSMGIVSTVFVWMS